jgi:hypothetical protein
MKKNLTVLCALILIMTALACQSGAKVEFVKGEHQIDVMVDGKLFTTYLYKPELVKPILYPIMSPSGVTMNRGFPYKKVEGERTDHPHHTGVFFTIEMKNGNNFWGRREKPPEIKHIKVEEMVPGRGKGVLKTVMHWISVTGLTMLEEARTMEFIPGETENIVDFTMTLTAKDTTVVFHDTKEGMFAIRVAHWLREREPGTGRYLSSNGEETERDVWGKKAKWMRLQGNKDGQVYGIAILNHPSSIYYPNYWHARGYGLFSANPLGQLAFQRGRKLENPEAYNLTLKPGESALFKYRMILYEGERTAEQIETEFSKYSK